MKLPFASKKQSGAYNPENGLRHLSQNEDAAETCWGDEEPVQGLSDLYSPERTTQESHTYDIADVLLETGKIDHQQYGRLRQQQRSKPASDVAALLQKDGVVDEDDILMAKARIYGLEFRHIEPHEVEQEVFEKLELDFIKRSSVCPVAIEDGTLIVATSEPANIFAIEDAKRQTDMDVKAVACSQEAIEQICEAFKEEDRVDYSLDEIISDMTDVEVVQEDEEESEDLERMAGQSPVIKFVNYAISNAIREGASDIHIEPKAKIMKTRCRIDGVLFEMMQSPIKMHPAIVSRIKIMANLDISERRLPQDGKISVIVGGREVDLRVSTLPTSQGEKVVIRVLDSNSVLRGLEHLGMSPDIQGTFVEQIALPHGIMLVTGPTGSGKSTTLYTALCQMDSETLNVSTVEDPVEYELDFCNQVQINDRIGLTFAASLRSLLRQDPDVIMVGEIRDSETARIAVQAALTGHLVLSTLHTNDAASSITRLVNIGIDAYLIAASLNSVLAQRLVRKICDKCKESYELPSQLTKYVERAGINTDRICHGAGCDACRGSGYSGRVGIYEMLVVDDRFRDMINQDSSMTNMRRAFQRSGQRSLFEDGMLKVQEGLTTIEEVLRVTEVYGRTEDEEFVENTG